MEKQGVVVISSEDLKTGKCHHFASFVILLGFEMVLDECTVQDIRPKTKVPNGPWLVRTPDVS